MICDTKTGKPISRLWRYAFVQLPFFKKGHEAGLAIGRAEGRAEEKYLIASKMLEQGFSFEKISEITDIPVAELKAHLVN